jgi:hypothetical protein
MRLWFGPYLILPRTKDGIFLFPKATGILEGMARIPFILFSTVIISLFLGQVTPSNAQETGTLSVTTTPVSGTIYVDYILMGARFWSGILNAGSHVVSFGEVDGYIAPSPQTVAVVAGQTYYVVGAYRKLVSLKE